MALNPYPDYNILHTSGVIDIRQGTRLKRKMAISIPTSHAGDGLRPIDASRDISRVIELLKLVFGDSLDADDGQFFNEGVPGSMGELLFRFNPAAARLSNGFVWQADGRIVGNATLLTTKAWDRYLVANVAVHPAYRRQGIARSLMQAVTSSVKRRGGRVILLQVVKENQPAIDLYKNLGYTSIGNIVTWYATRSRIRQIPYGEDRPVNPHIDLLPSQRWREAYQLDTAHVHRDLNWPEPLQPDAYRRTMWQRAMDFMNNRQWETWVTMDSEGHFSGLANITCEWGRNHMFTLRVHPDWAGQLERPLLAKMIRRLQYLPRRNVRLDHPEADGYTGELFKEANFSIQRILTHMRLVISD